MVLFKKNSDPIGRWAVRGAVLIVGLLMTACGTEQRHKVMTFFFEGVPEPGEAGRVAETEVATVEQIEPERVGFQPVVKKWFYHEPFELKACKDCHQSEFSQALLKDEPKLCYDCHGKILKKMEFVHKPAEDGTCKLCHTAHKSEVAFLLPKPELQLCNDCHKPMDNLKFVHTPVAEGHCSYCHNPHGGKNKLYLIAEGDDLCAECHEPDKMEQVSGHEEIADRQCLECHDAHQADQKGLLIAGAKVP